MGVVYSWLTTASPCDHLGVILLPQNRGPCRLLYGTCVFVMRADSGHILWSAQLPSHFIIKSNSNDKCFLSSFASSQQIL